MCPLSKFLEKENLQHLFELLKKEDITLDLLMVMDLDDLRRLRSDLRISWGDQYKIEKGILNQRAAAHTDPIESNDERTAPPSSEDLPSVSVQNISSEPSSSETAEEVSFLQETCDLCNVAEQSRNPQHRCRLCSNVVCNLFCSIQDPTSDNQMHRIHKPGHWKCQQIQGGFDSHEHPTYSSFTLLSEGSLSDVLYRCNNCNENFENEADLKDLMEKEDEEESFLEKIFA